MKNINTKIAAGLLAIAVGVAACKEPFDMDPKTNTAPTNLSARFVGVNASPDAPSLDFYVNNIMIGASLTSGVGQNGYTVLPITSNGTFANTNIRVKATTGTIGGLVGSNDAIFRAGNNNSNNFSAADGGAYTVIVVDTIKRPAPVRTLNSTNFADVTYYSSKSSFTAPKKVGAGDTTINLTIGTSNNADLGNLVKKYNGGVLPSWLVLIGVVPLASSDVGGIRFLVLTDELALPSTNRLPTPAAGKYALRFINASPDSGPVTVTIDGTPFTGGGPFTYPLLQTNTTTAIGAFNPSVGSRSATIAFTNNAGTSGAGPFTIVVKQGVNTIATGVFSNLTDGGVYTLVLTGSTAHTPYKLTLVKNK